MKYYVDCEFDGHGGPLLSIALVADEGRSIYIKTNNEARDEWVLENVVPLLNAHECQQVATVHQDEVGGVIRAFIGDDRAPVIVADSPVDIGRFCEVISTNNRGGWQPTGYPRMSFEVHNVDCYPTSQRGAVRHNAWWDAVALWAKLRETGL